MIKEENKIFGVIYKSTVLAPESSFHSKIYIGKSICKSVEKFYESRYTGSGRLITYITNKYSKENIETEVIYVMFDNDIQTGPEKHKQLGEWEKHFIKLYDSQNPKIGINLTIGGNSNNGTTYGQKRTEDWKKEQSKRIKNVGYKISNTLKNYYKIHGGTRKGKITSEITKQKQKKSANVRWSNPEERKRKSERNKKYYKTLDGIKHRNKIKNTLTGRKDSYITKKRKSDAQKRRNYIGVIRNFKLICKKCKTEFIGTSGNQKLCLNCKNIKLKNE
jgi:hypothetical protein